jgi:ATP-dependent Clp protease protease subunit
MSFKVSHHFEGLVTQSNDHSSLLFSRNNLSNVNHIGNSIVSASPTKVNSSLWEPIQIFVGEDIDIDMANEIDEKIKLAELSGQPFLPIFIHSNGGDVYATINIVDSIKRCKIPVYTFVNSCAFSCGAVLFCCGQKRFIGQHARLLLHDVSIDISHDTSITSSNLSVESKEMRKLNQLICYIMAEQIGQPITFFLKLLKTQRNNDVYIDADKALELKLATCIGVPTIKLTYGLHMELDIQHQHNQTNPSNSKSKYETKKRKKTEKTKNPNSALSLNKHSINISKLNNHFYKPLKPTKIPHKKQEIIKPCKNE